jgi:hypothetical protein
LYLVRAGMKGHSLGSWETCMEDESYSSKIMSFLFLIYHIID